MTNYLLLMYITEGLGPAADAPESEVLSCAFPIVDRTTASGHYRAAGVLRPTSTSLSVRVRDGKRLITDGPFAETHEQLAGFLLIEAETVEEAIKIAEEHPAAQTGTVEIRPIVMLPPAKSD